MNNTTQEYQPLKIEVICIAGLARAGKGTIASKLVQQFGYSPEKFAKPLYAMLATMYDGILPLDIATIEDMKKLRWLRVFNVTQMRQ